MIRVILVDDEPMSLKNLEFMLHEEGSGFEVIATATNTKDAEIKLKLLKPDVLFLDIEMPNETGISFLERLNNYDFEVVFVTAYNEYAVKAFKLNALDYILKPINRQDIKHCIQRIQESYTLRQTFRNYQLKERLLHLNAHSNDKSNPSIILRTKDNIEIIPYDNIIYLSADGAYSIFHYIQNNQTSEIMMSYPLAYYEEILPVEFFLRVHKSYIVNKLFIESLIRDPNYYIITKFQTRIPISKRRVSQILDKL